MKSFAISRFQAGLVQSAFYMGYFLLAIPAALLMRRFGYKSGFSSGLLLSARARFSSGRRRLWGSTRSFSDGAVRHRQRLSFLETAVNPFIAQIGMPERRARRLNFSQAFNPLGAITGVLIGTVFIFSGVELNRQIAAKQTAGHLCGLSAL